LHNAPSARDDSFACFFDPFNSRIPGPDPEFCLHFAQRAAVHPQLAWIIFNTSSRSYIFNFIFQLALSNSSRPQRLLTHKS